MAAELSAVLLKVFPDEAAPNLMMGKALADQGKLHDARSYLEKSLEINRHNQPLLFVYARLLLDLDADPDEIRPVVEELLRDYPRSRKDIETYFKRASKGEISFED